MWMNTWEIDEAACRWRDHPVLGPATKLLGDLRDLANNCSDGWCYWPKPARAAGRLMELIQGDPALATPAALRKALIPIRAFCTRQAKHLRGERLAFPAV